MATWCQGCGTELDYASGDVVGRTASCAKCRADLHACVQCTHYDVKAYNQCREPQAERVDDRAKANFCEYFRLRTARPGVPQAAVAQDRAGKARAKLDSLFTKKPGGE